VNSFRLAVYLLLVAVWLTARSMGLNTPVFGVFLGPAGHPVWTRNGERLPPVGPRPSRPSRSALGLAIPLNQADAGLLEEVPGIGPKRAAAIVKNRALNGCFLRMSDLDRVRGFGVKTVVKVAPFLMVNQEQGLVCASQQGG
jgi:competence ComEA-like helix-hairpin-helix protein